MALLLEKQSEVATKKSWYIEGHSMEVTKVFKYA